MSTSVRPKSRKRETCTISKMGTRTVNGQYFWATHKVSARTQTSNVQKGDAHAAYGMLTAPRNVERNTEECLMQPSIIDKLPLGLVSGPSTNFDDNSSMMTRHPCLSTKLKIDELQSLMIPVCPKWIRTTINNLFELHPHEARFLKSSDRWSDRLTWQKPSTPWKVFTMPIPYSTAQAHVSVRDDDEIVYRACIRDFSQWTDDTLPRTYARLSGITVDYEHMFPVAHGLAWPSYCGLHCFLRNVPDFL